METESGSKQSSTSGGRLCRYCAKPLEDAAVLCATCGHRQKWWRNHVRVDHIGLLIALGAMYLGYRQFVEARRDRVEASEALSRASRAPSSSPTFLSTADRFRNNWRT